MPLRAAALVGAAATGLRALARAAAIARAVALAADLVGAVGSVGAVSLWILGHHALKGPYTGWAFVFLGLVLGLIFTPIYLKNTSQEDPKEVVIDEALGQWIALISAGGNPLLILLALILFRVLDIFKPWPINKIDNLSGGLWKNTFSVLFDDVVAGLITTTLILFLKKYIYLLN